MTQLKFEDLKEADKIYIVLEDGECLDDVFVVSQTDKKLIVLNYVYDEKLTIEKSSIIELAKH